jgi:hypothetical protein
MKKTTTTVASLAMFGLLGGFAAGAAQADDTRKADPSCRQEIKRVAVWPHGPKGQRVARFEDREITICDGKVVARRKPQEVLQANESGQ